VLKSSSSGADTTYTVNNGEGVVDDNGTPYGDVIQPMPEINLESHLQIDADYNRSKH